MSAQNTEVDLRVARRCLDLPQVPSGTKGALQELPGALEAPPSTTLHRTRNSNCFTVCCSLTGRRGRTSPECPNSAGRGHLGASLPAPAAVLRGHTQLARAGQAAAASQGRATGVL